jgi:hypothetical protein
MTEPEFAIPGKTEPEIPDLFPNSMYAYLCIGSEKLYGPVLDRTYKVKRTSPE